MDKIKQHFWIFKKKNNEFYHSNEFRHYYSILRGSFLSLLMGFIFAGILIACLNVNPFSYFANLFKIAFNPLWVTETFQWTSVYIVAALSVGIGFSAGLFNIGVAGQMLFGSGASIIVLNSIYNSDLSKMNGSAVFLAFLLCVSCSTLLSTFSGWLKTQFNIHEVVSTIMFNWIVWYFLKFIFSKWSYKFAASNIATNPIPSGMLGVGNSQVLIPLLIAFACVALTWFLLRKTVFGFKIKAVGKSNTVAQYAGVKVKNKIIATMAISGALAGVAAFLNIFTVAPNIYIGSDNLPTIGYDAIAVALVAFNSPIGIIIVGFIWGILQSAGQATASLFTLPIQLSLVIFGFIVYFAAISIIFIRWNPVEKIRLFFIIRKSSINKNKITELRNLIKKQSKYDENFYQELSNLKKELTLVQTNKEKKDINNKIKALKLEANENYDLEIRKIKSKLKNYKTEIYKNYLNTGRSGMKYHSKERLLKTNLKGLESVEVVRLNYAKNRNDIKHACYLFNNKNQIYLKNLAKEYKTEKNVLKAWRQGEVGIANGKFDFISGKTTAYGIYKSKKHDLSEKIKNIKIDCSLKKYLIRFDNNKTSLEKLNARKKVTSESRQQILNCYKKNRKLRITLRAEIADLKKSRIKISNSLKRDSSVLDAINDTYNDKIHNLKSNYDLKVYKVIEQENIDNSKIDFLVANENYKIANSKLNDISSLKTIEINDLNKLNKEIIVLSKVKKDIYELCGGLDFTEKDNQKTARLKSKLYLKLAHLNYIYLCQQTILKANQEVFEVKEKNQKILKECNLYFKSKNIVSPKSMSNEEYQSEMAIANKFIQQLENKYFGEEK